MSSLIDSKLLFEVLKGKGVNHFHHANTVATSLTFIKYGALLSRDYVEKNKLVQTDQYTDGQDKKFQIWDSIFLDAWDLHSVFGINYYGPVLFLFDLNILLDENFPTVRVTKTNPSNWSSSSFFMDSIEDVEKTYLVDNKFNKSVDGVVLCFCLINQN